MRSDGVIRARLSFVQLSSPGEAGISAGFD